MTTDEWKACAKERILSGAMTNDAWDEILSALLVVEEDGDLFYFKVEDEK